MAAAKSPASLKAQALRWVSQREHSTVEMRRKLLDAVRRRAASADPVAARPIAARRRGGLDASAAGVEAGAEADADANRAGVGARSGDRHPVESTAASPGDDDATTSGWRRSASARSPEVLAEVDDVVAWLLAYDFLSDQRFIESRAHARASGQGCSRIRRELQEHGLDLSEPEAAQLRQTEFERACALCRRRFGDAPAASASEDARRYRFLMRRGFAGDVVARVLRDAKRAD